MRAGAVALVATIGLALTGCGDGSTTAGRAPTPTSGGPVGERAGVAASCAGPLVTVSPTSAAAGDDVHVRGRWFAADCYDTGQTGTPPPLTGLELEVMQDGSAWTLARDLDATGEKYELEVTVRLPTELKAGPAVVRVVGYGSPADLQITAG